MTKIGPAREAKGKKRGADLVRFGRSRSMGSWTDALLKLIVVVGDLMRCFRPGGVEDMR